MTTHTRHEDISLSGLADSCPRCAELAEDPYHTQVGDALLLQVLSRALNSLPPRSLTEGRAMTNVVRPLRRIEQLRDQPSLDPSQVRMLDHPIEYMQHLRPKLVLDTSGPYTITDLNEGLS